MAIMATMPLFRSCPEACGHRALPSSSQLSLWQHVNKPPNHFGRWKLDCQRSGEVEDALLRTSPNGPVEPA